MIETNYIYTIDFTQEILVDLYPPKPNHTCKHSIGLVENNKGELKTFQFTEKRWRDREEIIPETGQIITIAEKCDACLYDRVYRICKQIEWEIEHSNTNWFLYEVDSKKFTNFRRYYTNTSKNKNLPKLKYLGIPIMGNLFVFSNTPMNKVELYDIPKNKNLLFNTVLEYISEIDIRSRIKVSQGFGGDYSGSKGDNRKQKPEIRFKLKVNDIYAMKKVAKEHGINLGYKAKSIDIIKFLKLLKDNDIDFFILEGYDELKIDLRKEGII